MKLASLLALALLVASTSFAADAEKTDKTTVDHSKNPITGSHTTEVKTHHKRKNAGGKDVDATATETTKVSKDGEVKKDLKVEEKAAH